jgi:hypothetical protein
VCTGSDPENAWLCSGDDTGLTANTPKTAVDLCSGPTPGTEPKCQFSCKGGYALSGGVCVSTGISIVFEVCDVSYTNCGPTIDDVVPGVMLILRWTATNADNCYKLSGPADFSTSGAPLNSDAINANTLPGKTDTYEMYCTNALGGYDTAAVTVNTIPAGPVLTSTATIVPIGSTIQLSWDTNNTPFGKDEGECKITVGDAPLVSADETKDYDPLPVGGNLEKGTTKIITVNGRTTYALTCPSNGTAYKTIDVIPDGWES